MTVVGKVESLWRYPVKSMRGEEISQSYLGFSGVYGDRLYAFHDKSAPEAFPFLTGREQEQMLRYQPRFRHPDNAVSPPNLAEAEANEPGLTPVYADTADLTVDIQTPSGELLAIDDPALIARLPEGPTVLSRTAVPCRFSRCRPCGKLARKLASLWTSYVFGRTSTRI